MSAVEQLKRRSIEQHLILMLAWEEWVTILVTNATLDLYAFLQTSVRPMQMQLATRLEIAHFNSI